MAVVRERITRIVEITAVLYAARRYYRNWGATKGECQVPLPGDESVGDPVVQVTEAVWVEAPPETIWPLLLRIGQERGAERQQLSVWDVLRLTPKGWMGLRDGLALRVEAITPGQSIVLHPSSPNLPKVVWSVHLQPHWDRHTRLLARARVGLRHPGEVFAVELARPAIALMTRAVLLGMKRRAERQMNYLATSEFYC